MLDASEVNLKVEKEVGRKQGSLGEGRGGDFCELQPVAPVKTVTLQRGMVVGDRDEDSHDSHARYRGRGRKQTKTQKNSQI